MAFCMAIILFVIGYILIHKDDSNMTPAEKAEIRNYESHSADYEREYLLVWGVYAYYAKQGPSVRPQPYQDAVRHTRLEMMRRGYRTTATLWYDFKDITPQIENRLNFMGHYTDQIPSGKMGYGFPCHMTRATEQDWPFKNARGRDRVNSLLGPHKTYWGYQTTDRDKKNVCESDKYHSRYLFNRLAEWYYLVMFKDEYIARHLDIRDALMNEETIPEKYQLRERAVDSEWDALLSEIQGIVYWGDKWDAEIHEYQRQKAEQKEAERRATEEPGEERRRKLLEQGANSSPSQPSLPTPDEMTPEWAKQQLKEKYGIDYDAEDSR